MEKEKRTLIVDRLLFVFNLIVLLYLIYLIIGFGKDLTEAKQTALAVCTPLCNSTLYKEVVNVIISNGVSYCVCGNEASPYLMVYYPNCSSVPLDFSQLSVNQS